MFAHRMEGEPTEVVHLRDFPERILATAEILVRPFILSPLHGGKHIGWQRMYRYFAG